LTVGEGGSYKGVVTKDLAALLAEEGAVPADVLERALLRQREAGGALDTALLELRALEEERLLELLARASGLPAAPAEAWGQTDARARRVFPSRVAERHGLAPFRLDGRELKLVATHPVDHGLLDEISFMLSLHLTAHVGPEWRVRELIHKLYGGALPPRLAALASGGPPVPPLAPAPEAAAEPAPPEAPAELLTGLDFSSDEEEASSRAPEPQREPPPLPTVFEAADGDALAAALEQAVEAVELGFLDDVEVTSSEEPGVEGLPDEPVRRAPEAPPAPEALDRSAPPRWTLEQARAALAGAKHRDEVVVAALRYARDFFEFAALFAVARDAIAGHDALGLEDGTRDLARSVALYASEPGVLRTVLETGGPYLGPVTREPGTDAILLGLARGSPRTVLVFPVLVRGRVVCLIYADNGEAPVSARRLGDLLTALAGVGVAFERVLREQKKRAAAVPDAPETWRTREPARLPQPDPAILGEPEPPVAVPAADEPVAPVEPPEAPGRLPLEAYLPPEAAPEEPAAARPPEPPGLGADAPPDTGGEVPDPDPTVTEDVLEPESEADLERATAEALAAVEAAETAEVQAAPPIRPPPLPPQPPQAAEPPVREPPFIVQEAAPPAAAGPDVEVAFEEPPETTDEVALPPPEEPLGAIADRVFAADPAVSAEAIEVLAARRKEPGLREATDRLRRALLSGLSARSASAARALAAVRDVESVPLMVQVLEKADPQAAEAVAGALRAITLQPLGKDPMRWLLWWKENRGRGRAEWLFGALTHPLKEIRQDAAAELARTAPAPVDYDPDWDLPKLQQATADWAAWWAKSGLVI